MPLQLLSKSSYKRYTFVKWSSQAGVGSWKCLTLLFLGAVYKYTYLLTLLDIRTVLVLVNTYSREGSVRGLLS